MRVAVFIASVLVIADCTKEAAVAAAPPPPAVAPPAEPRPAPADAGSPLASTDGGSSAPGDAGTAPSLDGGTLPAWEEAVNALSAEKEMPGIETYVARLKERTTGRPTAEEAARAFAEAAQRRDIEAMADLTISKEDINANFGTEKEISEAGAYASLNFVWYSERVQIPEMKLGKFVPGKAKADRPAMKKATIRDVKVQSRLEVTIADVAYLFHFGGLARFEDGWKVVGPVDLRRVGTPVLKTETKTKKK